MTEMGDDTAGDPGARSRHRTELAHPAGITPKRIEPKKGWVSLGLDRLWMHRELTYFFVWRDLKVRYKQTVLGALWAILQPVVTMVVFSLFFGRLAKVPSDNLPYPIFSLAALVPWSFLANSVTQASNSLVNNAEMLKKVSFPRMALPLSTVVAAVLDFALASGTLVAMMLWYNLTPKLKALWVAPFFLLVLVTALGVALWLSAMNVLYRDVRYAVPFLLQVWLFATPIAYPSSLVPEGWRALYALNPMVGAVEGFRWALLDTRMVSLPVILVSSITALGLLLSGAVYFRRVERSFADVV